MNARLALNQFKVPIIITTMTFVGALSFAQTNSYSVEKFQVLDSRSQGISNPRVLQKPNINLGLKTAAPTQKLLLLRGGGDTGGGTFVQMPGGQRVLLDLYLHDPSLKFSSEVRSGTALPTSKAFALLGLDQITQKHPALQNARSLVARWSKSSPKITGALSLALERTPFLYMNYRLNFRDAHYFMPSNENGLQMETAAIYIKDLGVVLAKATFDSLDEVNQAATLIHEALRHVQINYQYKFSDKTLQAITASIVLDQPIESTSLDDVLEDGRQIIPAHLVGQKICAEAPRYPKLDGYCERMRSTQNPQEIIDIAVEASRSLDSYFTKISSVVEAQALSRVQQDILTGALAILNESIYTLADNAKVPSRAIYDVILRTKLIGLRWALENPSIGVAQKSFQNAFQELLDLGLIN